MTTYVTTAIEEAFVNHWNRTAMPRSGGTGHITQRFGNLNLQKQDSLLDALRHVVQLYRDGTRWDSTLQVGRAFWTAVYGPTNACGWTRNYSTDDVACEAIGQWLHGQQSVVEGLPVQILNPVPEVPVGYCSLVGYTADGTLYGIVEMHSDRSVSATDGNGDGRAFADGEITLLTKSTPMVPAIDYPDGIGSVRAGQTVYMTLVRGTERGTHPSIYVSTEPDMPDHDYLGFITLRHLRVDVAASSGAEATIATTSPTVEFDGVLYVPLALVEHDLEVMRNVIHRGATDNGLCSVYDKVMAQSDEATAFLKMGVRPKMHVVYMERPVTVSWRVEVMAGSEDEARRIATDRMGSRELIDRAPDAEGVYGLRGRYDAVTITRVNT